LAKAGAGNTEAEDASHEHAASDIAYYTCAMHSSVRASAPGNCPICGMTLQPVTVEEARTGVIVIDAQRRQSIGVKTALVARHPLTVSIRALGRVTYDQARLADVSLKIRGWVGELQADALGQFVERGQVLFTLYSPELYAAQKELLSAVISHKSARSAAAPDRVDYLVEAARQRLRLWDLQPAQIDQIVRAGKPSQYLPILSPLSGYVVEKEIVAGATVEPGARLYRIAGSTGSGSKPRSTNRMLRWSPSATMFASRCRIDSNGKSGGSISLSLPDDTTAPCGRASRNKDSLEAGDVCERRARQIARRASGRAECHPLRRSAPLRLRRPRRRAPEAEASEGRAPRR
jgi:hypothetical protein